MTQMKMLPVGYVSVGEDGFCLEIEPPYRRALNAVEGFSHLNVLWWCDQLDEPEVRKTVECEKPYKNSPAKVGIFATRSPARPNPIALTPVAVLALEPDQGIIRIPYIDAEDGTPIVDIKPYHPATDRVKNVSVPAWCAHWPQWYEDSATFDWQDEFVNAQ